MSIGDWRIYGLSVGRLLASRRWDVGLAAAVTAVCEIQAATGSGDSRIGGPAWLRIASRIVFGGPLLWRRIRPEVSLAVLFTSAVVMFGLGLSQPTQGYIGEIVAGVATLYALASMCRLGLVLGGFGYAYVAVFVSSPDENLYNRLGSLLVLGTPVMIGRVLHARRVLIERLRATTEELRCSQVQNAEAAVVAERVAIARELHDVVAHAVSVMVIQAGAAEQVLDSDSRRARQSILAVQEAGRDAVVELRRLLGALRPGAPSTTALRPQPGLAQLERMVEQVQGAGLRVEVTTEGLPRHLSASVDLAAFRIVQESLTNALKHAQAAVAKVTIRYTQEAIEIEVEDDGQGGQTNGSGPGHHGLIGMHERASIYGGEVSAGPRPDGGFLVLTRLPTGKN